jgi:hypothetical protein
MWEVFDHSPAAVGNAARVAAPKFPVSGTMSNMARLDQDTMGNDTTSNSRFTMRMVTHGSTGINMLFSETNN